MDWRQQIVPLQACDGAAMYALEQEMFAALPDSRWYFGSSKEEFALQASQGHAWGIWQDGRLIALNVLVPAARAHHGGYAAILGRDDPDSLNFEDVMVSPAWRRQGIHSAMISHARSLGYASVYATVDPDNLPSLRAFEKAGFSALEQRLTYDGRPRVFLHWQGV